MFLLSIYVSYGPEYYPTLLCLYPHFGPSFLSNLRCFSASPPCLAFLPSFLPPHQVEEARNAFRGNILEVMPQHEEIEWLDFRTERHCDRFFENCNNQKVQGQNIVFRVVHLRSSESFRPPSLRKISSRLSMPRRAREIWHLPVRPRLRSRSVRCCHCD
jgi:hypothetical protein